MRPSCIALDLDQTLIHYRGEYEGMFEPFTKRNVPKKIVETARDNTTLVGGFSIVNLLVTLRSLITHVPDEPAIERELEMWFKNCLALYDDASRFMKQWEKKHTPPLAIVTRGDETWQRRKVEFLTLAHDHLFVTEKRITKCDALRKLITRYGAPLIFVDDKASELDRVREEGLGENAVLTVLIKRPESIYRDQKAEFPHRVISTLEDLNPILAS